jgi:hypothetical protein
MARALLPATGEKAAEIAALLPNELTFSIISGRIKGMF